VHPLLALRLGYSRQRPTPVRAPHLDLLTGALLARDYRSTRSAASNRNELRIAKTASRHILGVMNQMALEIGWHADQAGGLWNIDSDELNRHLRRNLHNKGGDYQLPLELVRERLQGPR
jgi:Domain of unknown function (DUF6933)